MNDKPNLNALFDPRAIAVIGATETQGRVGRIIFEGLIPSGRRLVPVHPKEKTVLGYEVIADISALPPEVDVAMICIGAEKAVESAEACALKGIPFVVIVAGGFGETGEAGKALEARLRAIPKKTSTRVLGPNTLGIHLPGANLDTIFVEHGDKALGKGGSVAFITQSGSVGVEALGQASNIGYGMRAFVGLGNKCDLDELDFLHHFADDPESRCLAFYVESLETGRSFLEAAREVSKKKPVVILKAGRTAAGATAVSSHTGRLAGSDKVMDSALRQYGLLRVFDDEELCDATKALSMLPAAKGNRVAIVTPAGGYGVMGADHVETARGGAPLTMAKLQKETEERIRAAVLPFASAHNPIDLTASADDKMFGATLDALIDDPGVDIVICIAFFAPPAVTDGLLDEVAERVRASEKPIIVFTQYGPFTENYLKRFFEKGVVGFPSIGRAVRAARCLVERAQIVSALKESR